MREMSESEVQRLRAALARAQMALRKAHNYSALGWSIQDMLNFTAEESRVALEALSITTEPAGARWCMELPLADEAERQAGWTLSPRYLDEIQNKVEGYEDCPSWEGIQLVLLAHYGLPLPKADEEGEDQA
jgi:hypothetical protein